MKRTFVKKSEVWTDEFEIASYHMDPFGFLKLSSLFELIQDAASKDAARKGFGYHELLQNNRYWVLLRALLKISRIPRWEEKVRFMTWPKESTGVVAFRDFRLESLEGEELLIATSTWSQLHTETRRPVRIEAVGDEEPDEVRHALKGRPDKVVLPEDMIWSDDILVKYSQIDVNKHVNNTRYLEWVLNEMPFEVLENHRIIGMEVNFLSEGMLGDTLRTGYRQITDQEWVACVERVSDRRKVYAVKFVFASR